MPDEFYASGIENALEDLVLEEVAYIPAQKSASLLMGAQMLGRGALAAGRGLKNIITAPAKAYGKHVSQPLGAAGQKAEAAIGQQAAQRLSPQAASRVQRGVKDVGEQALRQGAGGAVFGGTLMGGLGAAQAEEGQRLKAFGKGFGEGAVVGAIGGGVGGGAGQGVHNVARMGLGRMARSGANPTKFPSVAVHDQLNRGFKQNVKSIFKPGDSPLGRGGAALAAATPAAALATDFMVGDAALSALTPKTGAVEDVTPEFHNSAMPIVGAAMGSGTGTIGTLALRRALHRKGLVNPAALTSEIIPAVGATAGSLGGYATAQKLYPSKREHQLKKLEDIDIDKLMRYYKAKPVDQAATSS